MMKLLKLSSSNQSFKTLEFNEGLNILAGLQLSKEDKKTYNGIGKSFSLNLIHLLLGAKLDQTKQKEKKVLDFLSSYGTFYLSLIHQDQPYEIRKNFSEGCFYINEEKILKSHYLVKLREIFISPTFDSRISFKQILNTFARRFGGNYYSEATTQQGRPTTDYYQVYVNLTLLGIDTKLVREKELINKRLKKLDDAKKVVSARESSLPEESNVKDIQDELNVLIQERDEFVIAENYDKYKQKADNLTNELNDLRNKIHTELKKLMLKTDSLEQSQSISVNIDEIKKIYAEANFFFPDKVVVRLKQANEFHLKLMNSRKNRLESELINLNEEISKLRHELTLKEKQRDSLLKDLDSTGALEEYNSINERIRSLEKEVTDLGKYRALLDEFTAEKTQLNLDKASLHTEALQYLTNSKNYKESIEDQFRTLVKKFYENHGGSLNINLANDAKYLYNVDIHVPQDGSQGINEVKVFCYDFLLYELNPDLLGFIAHDGSIFSEMDPRQKSMIFKVALEYVKKHNLQYFVNIGQASLEEVLDSTILSSEEKSIIENSVILKLYDMDPSKWLFGKRFG